MAAVTAAAALQVRPSLVVWLSSTGESPHNTVVFRFKKKTSHLYPTD
jgi:hypothetical protein